MPTTTTRDEGKGKMERAYGSDEGAVKIWYHTSNTPEENGFSQIVKSTQMARQWVEKMLEKLKTFHKDRNEKVEKILKKFFGIDMNSHIGEAHLEGVLDSYQKIYNGITAPFVICLSQKRWNSKDISEDVRGYHGKQIHIHLSLLEYHPSSLARTIIHECAHRFVGAPGSRTDSGFEIKELYVYDKEWEEGGGTTKRLSADSYAWAALSMWHNRIVTPGDYNDWEGVM